MTSTLMTCLLHAYGKLGQLNCVSYFNPALLQASLFYSQILNEDDSLVTATFENDDQRLLSLAAWDARPDLVRVLIDAGAEIDAVNTAGRTALIYASYNDAMAARLLLEAGADAKATTNSGDTPLHDAASDGRVDIARMLLKAGADIDAQNDRGQTPLMWAVDSEVFPDMVKFLVKNHADVDIVGELQRYSALHSAAETLSPENVRTLLAAGADVTVLNDDSMTPLVLAISKGIRFTEVIKAFIIPGPSLLAVDPQTDNNVLNMCIEKEIPGCTRRLLELGTETLPFTLEEVSDKGFTPLMQTIRSDQYESAMLLIDNGADVNVPLDPTPGTTDIPSGTTPLMMAARKASDPGTLELVQKLLDNGGNVVTTDSNAETPFTVIPELIGASEYSAAVLAEYIGAIPSDRQDFIDAPNRFSKSPLTLSFENAYPDNLEELLFTYQFVEAGANLAVLTVPHLEWLTQQAIADERHEAATKIFASQFRVATIA